MNAIGLSVIADRLADLNSTLSEAYRSPDQVNFGCVIVITSILEALPEVPRTGDLVGDISPRFSNYITNSLISDTKMAEQSIEDEASMIRKGSNDLLYRWKKRH